MITAFLDILSILSNTKSRTNDTLTHITFTFDFSGICPELLHALKRLDWNRIASTFRRFTSLKQIVFRFVLTVPATAPGGLGGMWVLLDHVVNRYLREWFCPTGIGKILVEKPTRPPAAIAREWC